MTEEKGGISFGCIVPHPPLLVPSVGRGQESAIRATSEAMKQLAASLAAVRPGVVVIMSPHGKILPQAMGVFGGIESQGDMKQWGDVAPIRTFKNDPGFASAILDECGVRRIPAQPVADMGLSLDHGVMVPLHFLASAIGKAPLIPLAFSHLSLRMHYEFGQAIASAAEKSKRRVAFIASGDLSHRLIPGAPAGYDPLGNIFDRTVVDSISAGNYEAVLNIDTDVIERAGECGLRSIAVLLGSTEGRVMSPKVLSYEGPFGVGYLVASFVPTLETPAGSSFKRHPLAELARQAVEATVTASRMPEPKTMTPEMTDRAGVFVSIKKSGELRGCIGTFEATKKDVAHEVISNAVSSATRDPRFLPVDVSELPYLNYSVDVLTRPEPISGPEQLDAKRFGVIVESGWKRGLLLPDLEGVDTVEQQLDICRRKAGIDPDEPVKLYRFEVRRYV